MGKQYYIYALKNPATQEIRYIGKTWNPELRMQQHLSPQFEGSNPLKYIWISELLEQGNKPEMVVLHTVKTVEEAMRCEKATIREYSKQFSLLNRETGALKDIRKYDAELQEWVYKRGGFKETSLFPEKSSSLDLATLSKMRAYLPMRSICKDAGIPFAMLYKRMLRCTPELTLDESQKLEKVIVQWCRLEEVRLKQISKELKRGKK